MGALYLTQQTEGAVVAVSSQQVAAVSRELVQDPIKRVNVIPPKKTAPFGDTCDACCECKDDVKDKALPAAATGLTDKFQIVTYWGDRVTLTCQMQDKQNIL